MTDTLLSVRVAQKLVAAQDIVSLALVDAGGGELPVFTPGAHIDVYLPGGLIRQYSLMNDCRDRTQFCIGVLREPQSRGGSIVLHDQVQVGDVLQISAPRNRFELQPCAHSLLLAGGIGITPLLCMARQLQAQAADFSLHYSCRTQARAAFLAEIAPLVQTGRAHLHFDDELQTILNAPAVLAQAAQQGAQVYVCGPAGYLEFIRGQASAAGLAGTQIHFERFALDESQRPQVGGGDVAFQVQLASTGEIFDIPADETVTQALDRQGVFIPVSCEEGICGTCLTGVKSGLPDHRDSYLTDDEHAANDEFTPCCSRALTPLLVLDL
ncbi:MAG TPA: PDR/VanB family oxidoreductase [Castellaniella sp.]|uniref:PDR/VanB family oxidoreductase n=1 Tax=Castellaniella sp. TaxID=1955812 RepID=UPI002F07F087